eukprot:TRINITY_DN1344_c0_g1::TRINITY_DN1344_c0_g1_i1::g.20058::m.20058 TRINITY_DN1344_c0_g1::TRINITY_DN1344_c0_g1_i1::g.20058  ORF type:complete len:177 (-),score=42.48,AflR/PF08493.5/0.33,DUF1631/PF07793.6/0.86 TRINITY_DN1344_c0_g1_i1:373-903(-)
MASQPGGWHGAESDAPEQWSGDRHRAAHAAPASSSGHSQAQAQSQSHAHAHAHAQAVRERESDAAQPLSPLSHQHASQRGNTRPPWSQDKWGDMLDKDNKENASPVKPAAADATEKKRTRKLMNPLAKLPEPAVAPVMDDGKKPRNIAMRAMGGLFASFMPVPETPVSQRTRSKRR